MSVLGVPHAVSIWFPGTLCWSTECSCWETGRRWGRNRSCWRGRVRGRERPATSPSTPAGEGSSATTATSSQVSVPLLSLSRITSFKMKQKVGRGWSSLSFQMSSWRSSQPCRPHARCARADSPQPRKTPKLREPRASHTSSRRFGTWSPATRVCFRLNLLSCVRRRQQNISLNFS